MGRPAIAAEKEMEVSARCREIRAAARSSALVLRMPRLEVAAVRPPKVGDITGTGLIPGNDFQLRTVVAYPVMDLLRGNSALSSAEAECRRLLAEAEAEEVLDQGLHFGQVEALREQIAVLTAGLPRIDALLVETKRRLERGIITVLESDDLELRRLRLEGKLHDLRHDLALLESQTPETDVRGLGEAVRRFESASTAAREERSFVRKVDAWHVNVQAGAIPYPQPDWYGMVSVGFNFGGFGQPGAEAEALAAGKEDLRTNPVELRARSERFTSAMRDSAETLTDELALLDKQLAFIQRRLQEVPTDSERMRQALASLEVERLELESRRAYVVKLRDLRAAAGRALE